MPAINDNKNLILFAEIKNLTTDKFIYNKLSCYGVVWLCKMSNFFARHMRLRIVSGIEIINSKSTHHIDT